MVTPGILYHELHTTEQLAQVYALEVAIWESTPADAVSAQVMSAITHNGGVVLGAATADDAETLIGYAFGIPARRADSWWLWSYAAGVLPAYQGQGVGFGLKQAQRSWALAHGYSVIRWTFDPLQRANANFNFCKLGVTADAYHVNLYGTMIDSINAGLPSDRFEVAWQLDDPRVLALASGAAQAVAAFAPPDDAQLLSQTTGGELLYRASLLLGGQPLYVEIPLSIGDLKHTDLAQAQRWQLAFRQALQAALAHGYIVTDFTAASGQSGRCWYRLDRS
ncbi:MAG: GNAT family N-acetyltransferase [Armatimonadetes bacterium]|nr:GNAT family N-acetyltransferase [Anaerolineae bacterium]